MNGPLNRIEGVEYGDPGRAQQYLDSGAWMKITVGEALRQTARRLPAKPALVTDTRTVTFEELDSLTDRLAAALLDIGLQPSDRAIFQMGNNIETALAVIACFKAGIVPVCAIPQYREIEIGQLARLSQARGYFVQSDPAGSFDMVRFAQEMTAALPGIEHLVFSGSRAPADCLTVASLIETRDAASARARLAEVRIGPEDVLSFQLSGGTTGVPKIIPRFHGEYLAHALFAARNYEMDEHSVFLWSLPLMHNAGQLYALMPTLALGRTTILMSAVDIARMLTLVEAHAVTHISSIGPIAPQVIAYPDLHKHDLSSLKLFFTMTRADALEQKIGVPCSNLYGITEGLLLGTGPSAPVQARHGTNGASGCVLDEVRVLEPESEKAVADGQMGELCFRGPSSLRGYFNAPEANRTAFTSDGFFRTGDIVSAHRIDGKTYYRFEGRLRDNVNRGGEKIGCEEVEQFVSKHPAILDAKLIAMPDAVYGEKGCVFVIVRPGAADPTVGELAAFLVAQGLAKFKCPERIEVVDAFPVTRVGKVDKPAMKKMIAEKLASEGAVKPELAS
ncbi:Non-ribosomal peptide synthetase component E (peptide arylation enzyme) [Noviherbaspirillum humi]|uniref:Long-chain-fatty-acid--CoA ligase n=1 Tax=Noviherbaspirillum humi TaxID=1688639 RepID=A0A239JUF0_9BURK|nr:AMP-binding protein [Noviherbaspirillum humi]SNT09556.1 Non-ribosomal peptide synthetase component E (peptide arylation enzyme) [Noviherbaspirillum humi]